MPGLTPTRSLPPEPLPSLNYKGYLGWIVDDFDLREGSGEDSDGVGSMEGEAEKSDDELLSESDNESDNDVSGDEISEHSSEHDCIGLDHERDDDGVPLFPNSCITYDDFNTVFLSLVQRHNLTYVSLKLSF